MNIKRRDFIKLLGAGGAVAAIPGLQGCATPGEAGARGRVVVVGGGFAGATCAKYIRMWDPGIDVVLVEANPQFISCPMSNLVVGGVRQINEVTRSYDDLTSKWGVKRVQDTVTAVDAGKREVRLARGNPIGYDRLVLAPGIDFMFETIPGLNNAAAQEAIPHAWKAGPQTLLLRRQLEAMRDGGVYAMAFPKMPYRCPPGPYERVTMIAHYFKTAKPRSKILVLDANPDIVSKKGLFMKAWADLYKGMIEYRPNSELADVDVATRTAKLQFDNVRADVLNVVPPQRAGAIAKQAGVVTANDRWCEVDFLTYESKAQKNIHVLGDATQSAPVMPKSGHMANQHGKICAAAIVAMMNGQPVNREPLIANTCYSYVSDKEAIHVASVHKYDPEKKTMLTVQGAGGVSSARNTAEAQYAWAWGQNIWADMLG
jgi:NADPH-dependent 2,4-dienoyl-CoA reductase/sulfur reductase-like enzyme